jgi:hypothetical protein
MHNENKNATTGTTLNAETGTKKTARKDQKKR